MKSWLIVNASADVLMVRRNVAEATTTNGIDMGDDVNMYAIEFETDVQHGVIRIPFQYRARLGTRVKVILLQEEGKQVERGKQPSSFEPIDYEQYFGVTNIGQEKLDRHLRRLRDEWERECI